MITLIHSVSLNMGLHLCCLEFLALLQVWLCSRTSKSLSLGDVLVLIKHQFHAATCRVNVWNNHVYTLSTNLVPRFYCLFDFRSISRNHKKIWNSTKISVTLGMYVIWGDSVQRLLTRGLGGGWPAKSLGRPASFWVCSYQNFLDTCLHEKGKAMVVEKVHGGRTHWTHVYTWLGRPAVTWGITTLDKSMELPHGPINTPYWWELTHTHHILEIPLANLPFLV
jgi:hypothetical protein